MTLIQLGSRPAVGGNQAQIKRSSHWRRSHAGGSQLSDGRDESRTLALARQPASVGRKQQSDSRDDCYPAVHRPSNLSGHKAAGQNVDALQEPNRAEERHDRANDVQSDSHVAQQALYAF